MGKYWLICIIIAVIVLFGTFGFITISQNIALKNYAKEKANVKESTIAIRYYIDDTQTQMVYERVEKGTTEYDISYIPKAIGKTFLGLYDGIDADRVYIDSFGRGLLPLTEDITLYPLFE